MTMLRDSATRVVDGLRSDVESAREVDHPLIHSLRFVAETLIMLGLGVRSLSYFATAMVFESYRREEDAVFTPANDPVLRWSYLGPGFEYDTQSRWEIRIAGIFTLVVGYVLYRTLMNFPLTSMELAIVYGNFGALFLEPAWTEVYLGKTSD